MQCHSVTANARLALKTISKRQLLSRGHRDGAMDMFATTSYPPAIGAQLAPLKLNVTACFTKSMFDVGLSHVVRAKKRTKATVRPGTRSTDS